MGISLAWVGIQAMTAEDTRSIVGFRHDEINPGIDDASFRALRPEPTGRLAKAARPKWKFW